MLKKFNLKSRQSKAERGFTLLEILIALSILAVSLTYLSDVRGRTIVMVEESKNLTIATGLARAALYDCEQAYMEKGFRNDDFAREGNFGDADHPDFFWECYVYKPDFPDATAGDIEEGLGAASSLGGGLGGAGDAAANNPMAGIGMGMIVPVVGMVSDIVADSIREMTVVVRWHNGDVPDYLDVTTHLVDTAAVQNIPDINLPF